MRKKQLVTILACLIVIQASGQVFTPGRVDSVLDSANLERRRLLDSLTTIGPVNRYRDSLRIIGWSDSLRNRINLKYHSNTLSGLADSLRGLNLPEFAINHRTDSLLRAKDVLLKEVTEKQLALQEKVSERYVHWSESLRKQFNLDSAGVKFPGLASAGSPRSLPGLSTPTTQLPLTGVSLPQFPALQTEDFSSLGISPELKSVGGDFTIPDAQQLTALDPYLPELPDPMKEINGQLAGAKSLTDNPTGAVEKAVSSVAELKQATTSLNEAEAIKQQSEALKPVEQMNSPEGAKEALQKEAVNHLVQEKALQGAMNQVAKYKKKYASLGSLSEIPKNNWLPRNGLKGQPFQKRFRVGLNSGFKPQGDTLQLDLYPNVSYRLTGRIEAGLGANYRLCIDSGPLALKQQNATWGLHLFTMVKAFKSVSLRLELDGSSFFKSETADHPAYRDWRWTFHTGIQTNFKLSKRWTGNVQMLYNFDSSLKDGFPEKLSPRVGVQYSLK